MQGQISKSTYLVSAPKLKLPPPQYNSYCRNSRLGTLLELGACIFMHKYIPLQTCISGYYRAYQTNTHSWRFLLPFCFQPLASGWCQRTYVMKHSRAVKKVIKDIQPKNIYDGLLCYASRKQLYYGSWSTLYQGLEDGNLNIGCD